MDLHKILGDIRKADQDYHLIEDGDRSCWSQRRKR